jgi:trehalose synthase
VGGIRRQILNGVTGFLVNTVEGTAWRVRQLLADPDLAHRMGAAGRQYVRDNFLLPQYLRKWILVMLSLRHPERRGVVDLAART